MIEAQKFITIRASNEYSLKTIVDATDSNDFNWFKHFHGLPYRGLKLFTGYRCSWIQDLQLEI
jgi:hypothetical protein